MPEAVNATVANPKFNVNQWMDGAQLTGLHWRIFSLATLLLAFNGFDLFVYSGSIPLIMKEFGISPVMAGSIASYMLLGALLGALFLGSLADMIGRKKALIFFIALFCLGMFMTGVSRSAAEFALWRFVTGLGVGASQPNITAFSTEFAPRRKRGAIIATVHSGMNIGGLMAALVSIVFYTRYGWRSVYLAGALVIVLLPIYIALLPESPLRLVRNRQFAKVRALMHKLRPNEHIADDGELEIEQGCGKAPIAAIFAEGRAKSTALFWVVQFMNSYGLFGFTIWLPKLIMGRGYSLATGLTFLLMMSAMAILGSFLGGALADKLGAKPGLVIFYLTSFVSVTLVGFTGGFTPLMLLVCMAGAGYHGAANLLNAYLPPYYPPSMRSTATSVVFAVSRIGALTGPVIIGALIGARFPYQVTLITLASPILLSAVCITLIDEKFSFARKVAEACQTR